jgi:N utilization substance protein B
VSGPTQSIRRRARERALEFLYGLSHTGDDWRDVLPEFWATFATREASREYAEHLIEGVIEQTVELDDAIDSALTGWTPDRVGRIERCILRIALFEMRYRPDVPQKAAINEAIELAKAYGAEDAAGFVNAVLDRLRDDASSASGTAS